MKFLSLEHERFGLDINDMSIKIARLKKRRRGFSLVSFYEKQLEPGLIEEGVIKNEEAVANVIKTGCKNIIGKKLNTKYVIVSLPEEKSFLQIIQMPKMKEEELKTAVPFEAENYIPLPISEVYLDFRIIVPVKEKEHLSNNLNVLIVATPKKIVNSYVSCIKKAGLIPVALEVEAEAVARALIKNETSDFPLVLLDFGKTNTDFIVFYGQSVYFTCSIPVSSEHLTNAISKKLKVSFDSAEKIKMKYDLSQKEKNNTLKEIFKAMEPVLNELTEQIKRYLNFYQDHASQKHFFPAGKIEKIFLCGGGASLKGLPEFFSKNLGISTELGNFWINFLPTKRTKKVFPKYPLIFTTAIGLALKKVDRYF